MESSCSKSGPVIRCYRVGGLSFDLVMESPWMPMLYSAQVEERVQRAAAGLSAMPVLPVRAGDKVPRRSFIQRREDLLPGLDPHMLDLSALEPFLTDSPDSPDFRLSIHAPGSEPFDMDSDEGLVMDVRDTEPYFRVLKRAGGTLFMISSEARPSLGCLFVCADHSCGDYYPAAEMSSNQVSFMLDMLLRIMYSYNSPKHSALLMHSSVVALDNEAVMFLAPSGTGKSTHSRLWLENIPGAELINDDNPVVRLEDEKLFVYGTPWSGKTPCYRNIRVPVKAIVCIKQAPVNEISRLNGIRAYAALVGGVSVVRWERPVMDDATKLGSGIAMGIPVYSMRCRPDAEAVKVCRDGVWGR